MINYRHSDSSDIPLRQYTSPNEAIELAYQQAAERAAARF
jgi:hypothetical protein